MMENEYGKSESLVMFPFFEALNAFEVQVFQGFICIRDQRHWKHVEPLSSDLCLSENIKQCLFGALEALGFLMLYQAN